MRGQSILEAEPKLILFGPDPDIGKGRVIATMSSSLSTVSLTILLL